MKTVLSAVAILLVPTFALADATKSGDKHEEVMTHEEGMKHGEEMNHGENHEEGMKHDEAMGHGDGKGHDEDMAHHEAMPIGKPATTEPSRTIKVVMNEDYDSDKPYIFEPNELTFEAGETVLLKIVNEGEEEHEFVMNTVEGNEMHREMMMKSAEMKHDEPNSVRLESGQEAEIAWTFGEPGTYEFACLLPGHYENGMHGPLVIKSM